MQVTQLEPALFNVDVSWIPSKHWHVLRCLCFHLVMIKIVKAEVTRTRATETDEITVSGVMGRLDHRINMLEKICEDKIACISESNKTLENKIRTTIYPQVDEWYGLDSGISQYQHWASDIGFYAYENINMIDKLLAAVKERVDFSIMKDSTRSLLGFYRTITRIPGHKQ